MNKTIQLQDLGNKDYKETWEYQEELFKGIVDLKIRNRREELQNPNYPSFVEHPHVYTFGKKWRFKQLIVVRKTTRSQGATFIKSIVAAILLIMDQDKLWLPDNRLDNFLLTFINTCVLEEAIIHYKNTV
jgi:hypothetical protein